VIDNHQQQVAIWDTSAINKLADRDDRGALIAGMKTTHCHWIPFDVFVEIAATKGHQRRQDLLAICRSLNSDTGRILLNTSLMLQCGIHLFSEFGFVDWEVLLKPDPELERAILDGKVLDDNLATVQKPETHSRLKSVEDFFLEMKGPYKSHFEPAPEETNTLDGFVEKCHSPKLIEQAVRAFCTEVLGHKASKVDWEKFARAFPPITAVFYAFAIAHFHRNELPAPKKAKPAGGLDLIAAAWLPLCHLFVSADVPQQSLFVDVAKCCHLQTRVVSFGNYIETFAI